MGHTPTFPGQGKHDLYRPGFRAFAGNADKDTEGATRHNKSKDAHGEMPLLWA